jgi:hypothetical protein
MQYIPRQRGTAIFEGDSMARRRSDPATTAKPITPPKSAAEELSDEKVRRWARLIIKTVLADFREIRLLDKLDIDSPDREILTQKGCENFLQIGEKTIREYRKMTPPIPYVAASNTFRYPRAEVLKWFTERALSSDLKGDPAWR